MRRVDAISVDYLIAYLETPRDAAQPYMRFATEFHLPASDFLVRNAWSTGQMDNLWQQGKFRSLDREFIAKVLQPVVEECTAFANGRAQGVHSARDYQAMANTFTRDYNRFHASFDLAKTPLEAYESTKTILAKILINLQLSGDTLRLRTTHKALVGIQYAVAQLLDLVRESKMLQAPVKQDSTFWPDSHDHSEEDFPVVQEQSPNSSDLPVPP